MGPREMNKVSVVGIVGALMMAISGCGMDMEEPPRSNLQLDSEDIEVLMQDLSVPCSVQVEGYGSVPMEEYVASVVACENGNAPPEALKAQAVAARTYATFIMAAENRPLEPTTRDQVYNCDYATVTQAHIDAAESTAGQVITHGEVLLAAFYVAGAIPPADTCVATGSSNDPTNTERFVTYNQGRIGNEVRPTSLGHPANRANRGAKSQNGATCLANKGWDYQRILRFYYGDETQARIAEGSACAGDGPPPIQAGDICSVAAGGTGGDSSSNVPGCVDPASTPTILPRSAWNARAPRHNRALHTPNRMTVHHTVTPNEAADGAHWVRQAQNWHMDGNGWSDIGYHFLISWDGTIYRGNPEERQGAHARNANSGNLGIALIGRYDTGHPSEAQIQSLTQMLRYLGDKYGIDLNRSNIQGHGEWPGQSTACPGTNLRNQLDAIVEAARGEASCQGGDSGGGVDPAGGPSEYRYVRINGVSNLPDNNPDTNIVDGFEVDAVYFERSSGNSTKVVPANRVACNAGVSNPAAALGHPDNTSCDNRPQTVAGVPDGASLIVELSRPMREGDQLFVTQHMYAPGMAACSPTGTAQISVSADGRVWKVLDPGATGNWSQTLSAGAFVIDEDDETNDPNEGFEVISPRAGHWYTPSVTFTALATNPAIQTVEYLADTWKMGESSTRSDNFRFVWEFQNYGERVILARGLDASGNVVAEQEFTITVTNYQGLIPEDQMVIPPLPDPTVANSEMAELLAVEGGKCYDPTLESSPRCSNGTGGYSTGQCWRFVKRALERAGIDYNRLQNAGPCSSYTFQLSAYGFRCNADPNPGLLREIGLERIDVAPQNAPRGAIISWQHGCNGYHAQHGHIEISQGDGIACSDYCGSIRAGGSNCASVYVPVSN